MKTTSTSRKSSRRRTGSKSTTSPAPKGRKKSLLGEIAETIGDAIVETTGAAADIATEIMAGDDSRKRSERPRASRTTSAPKKKSAAALARKTKRSASASSKKSSRS